MVNRVAKNRMRQPRQEARQVLEIQNVQIWIKRQFEMRKSDDNTEFRSCHSRVVVLLFVCVEVLPSSQPNGVMSSTVSLPNYTFTGQAWSSKQLTSIVHILSLETDNCPSWISGRERRTVENISRSISMKECCWPRRRSNLQPPGLQSSKTEANCYSFMCSLFPSSTFIDKYLTSLQLVLSDMWWP